ncbi:MAG: phosphatidate cytidylyltransferase [Gammaproteobacteria bacterium]|nr:phosphatidate cytidylyltransferase [Gammaproteobacteria bacterium]
MTGGMQIVLSGIAATLGVATLFARLPARLMPQFDPAELTLRVRTWWIITAVFVGALLLGREVFLLFLAVVSFLCLREFFKLVRVRQLDGEGMLWLYMTVPILYLLTANAGYHAFVAFIPIIAFICLSGKIVIDGDTRSFVNTIATVNWGLILTVFCPWHIGFLLVITSSLAQAGFNAGLVMFLVLLTEFNDVSQYIFGKLFGRHRNIVKVSPQKSGEGLVGGIMATALLAALVAPLITPLTAVQGVISGVLIAISGFFGDITMSAVKRELRIKDTGRLLPGHGGILDRMDSLLFTAPVFFHLVYQLRWYE